MTLVSIVSFRCALGTSVNGHSTEMESLQTSSPRGLLLENVFCGNSLNLIQREMC